MKLTTNGQAALTAMADIAMHQGTAPVSLIEISARQKISTSHLQKLFRKLLGSRLVRSVHGRYGGYRLGRDMASITIADIILAVDAPRSGRTGGVRGELDSITADLWSGVEVFLLDYLALQTLEQVVNGNLDMPKAATAAQNARIAAPSLSLGHWSSFS